LRRKKPTFKYVARQTQRRYGMSNAPAIQDTFQNRTKTHIKVISKIRISSKESSREFILKKSGVQMKFETRWKKRRIMVSVGYCLEGVFKYKKIEQAIKMYKIVQTGPKTQFGGVKGGLIRFAYQTLISVSFML